MSDGFVVASFMKRLSKFAREQQAVLVYLWLVYIDR